MHTLTHAHTQHTCTHMLTQHKCTHAYTRVHTCSHARVQNKAHSHVHTHTHTHVQVQHAGEALHSRVMVPWAELRGQSKEHFGLRGSF